MKGLYMSKYKIAIITVWFGDLPDYFPAWWVSAEHNRDIDFFIFSDNEIKSEAENIKCFFMTMQEMLEIFSKKLNRKIDIINAYKFCDCKPFFGKVFSDYLKEYDFWGYCDVDLMFGNIRHFLTDDKLEKYDRFYQYGHLSIFRNTDKMTHIYDMPGGIYSYEEILCGRANTAADEYFGINRICEKNNIRWYTNVDFIDFQLYYPNSLMADHGVKNYSEQIFIWKEGKVYQLVKKDGKIKAKEYVYMHWQKRKPKIIGSVTKEKVMVVMADKIECYDNFGAVKSLDFNIINPPITVEEDKKYKKAYAKKQFKQFIKADFPTKRIWLRQKKYGFLERKTYK